MKSPDHGIINFEVYGFFCRPSIQTNSLSEDETDFHVMLYVCEIV
jgi:hypothetical protein